MNRILVQNASGSIVKVAAHSIEANRMIKHLSYIFDEPFEMVLDINTNVFDPIKFILNSDYRTYVKAKSPTYFDWRK